MKKILSAILLSSLFVVISAVSAFAAEGTIAVSFKDAEGNAVDTLKVGESATMEMTFEIAGSPKIGAAEIFYDLDKLTLESDDANFTGSSFQIMNFSAADVRSAKWTATVTATEVGTASFIVTEDSYAADTDANEYYEFDVTGNTLTVVADAPAKEDVVIDDVTSFQYTDEYDDNGVAKKHAAFEVAFTVAENNNAVTALNVTGTKTAKVALKTAVTSGTCNVFINVLGVPADATLGTITVAPVAE